MEKTAWSVVFFVIIFCFTDLTEETSATCPKGCRCQTEASAKCHIPSARSIPKNTFPFNITSLDLSDNNILNVPRGCLNSLPNLVVLNLKSNKIYFLEDGAFKGARSIQNLTLEDNNLHVIEKNVFADLKNLVELNLMNNNLKQFPEVGLNTRLLSLFLSFNNIGKIPDGSLKKNDQLKEFRIRSNELQEISRNVFASVVSSYRALDLVRNRLRVTPSVVEEMINLESLKLCYNPIKVLKTEIIGNLKALKVLTLTGIGLSEFPNNGLILPQLEILDISKNKMSSSSLNNIRFGRLKKLVLSKNDLSTLPRYSFNGVPNLEILLARSCRLIAIDYLAFEPMMKLKVLDLANNRLTDPPPINSNVNIETLNLNQNNITGFPQGSLKYLTKLKSLSIANNSLTSLPSRVFNNVISITELNLSGNNLVNIPSVVTSSMTSLEELDVSLNELVDIASGLFVELTRLEKLNLRGNKFTELDGGKLAPLKRLKHLYLCHNNLTSLDNGIFASLSNLTEVTLNNNEIQQLSNNTFKNNERLKKIEINNNGLNHIGEEAFAGLTELSELMLIHNRLSLSPDVSGNPKLKIIGLCNNPIQNLYKGDLAGPTGLEVVLLRNLGLSLLEPSMFGNIKRIKHLNLAFGNHLTRIPSMIRNLTSLRTLKLTGNPIEYVSVSDFQGLNNLRELRLDKMKIQSMDVIELFPNLPAIRILYLAGNPWHCDCRVQWYALGVDGSRARVSTEDRGQIRCESPGRLAGKSLDYLRLGDFSYCSSSKIISINDTSAKINLPPLAKIATDHSFVYNKVTLIPLDGGKERTEIVDNHNREYLLSSLTPNNPYVVCVSTVTSIPRIVGGTAGPRSDGELVSSFTFNDPAPQESCLRFSTLSTSEASPDNIEIKDKFEDFVPIFMTVVHSVLGVILAIALIASVVTITHWCKKQRSSERPSSFTGIGTETNVEEGTHVGTPDPGVENEGDAENQMENDKIEKRKKKPKRAKDLKKDEARTKDEKANGDAVEMATGSGEKQEGDKGASGTTPSQRTKL